MRPLLTQPTQCQLQLQLQLLHVAAWCSVLQCVAVQPQLIQPNQCQLLLPNVATWCNALQCVAVQPQLIQPNQCQLLLPHVAAWCSLLQCSHSSHNPLDANCSHVAVRCSMLQRVAVRLYAKNAALFHLKQIPVPYKHKIVKALQHTATHCNTLQHTATHCNTSHTPLYKKQTPQVAATHCNTLQHTTHPTLQKTQDPSRCNTLQHTATRCNTLQHTATHCNTPHIPPYNKHKTQVTELWRFFFFWEQILLHFKKQKTKVMVAISTSDLAALGARTTGQTGARFFFLATELFFYRFFSLCFKKFFLGWGAKCTVCVVVVWGWCLEWDVGCVAEYCSVRSVVVCRWYLECDVAVCCSAVCT